MRGPGIRHRIVGITTALLTLAFVIGSAALAAGVWQAQQRTLDDQMRAVATEVATLAAENRLPATLPVSGARFVQVIDAAGGVVAASPAADRVLPLLSPDEVARARTAPVQVPASRVAGSGTLRALAVPVEPASRGQTVLVAAPVAPAAESQRGLWLGLALGVPLVLLVTGAVLWRAVGAALAPVESLRRGAERIGADAGDAPEQDRLPVPAADDEIRALALTLNGMLERLDAAAASQRRFVADAAHELRSPVASLRLQVEVADRLGDGGELPSELLPDIERLAQLVDDLLLLARAGSPRSTYRPEIVDVGEAVTHVVARYGGARVAVTAVGTPSGVTVRVDPGALERAMTNLLDNAVRHARTRVAVTLHHQADQVVLEVHDDGSGIAAADRDRVFDRFTRLDDARDRDAGGTGLGLPIVRELIEREGGRVTLHGAQPCGLVARMALPAHP